MNVYNFTERVRAVLAMAREEAAARGHEFVGTEHMLLAIVREDEGVASEVLRSLRIDVEAVRRMIDQTVKSGPATRRSGPDLPYTSRAKKALELSMAEAHERNHGHVGTEHLLLGVLREEKGIGAQVLVAAGARVEAVRAEMLRLLGAADTRTAGVSTSAVVAVAIELRYADGSTRREEFRSAGPAIGFLARLH